MKNYILLLRKDDIVDLFKYGKWIPYCPYITFDGDIDKLSQDEKACKSLFKSANPFDYSTEYYLLHVVSDTSKLSKFTINDVEGVYALDQQSQMIGIELSPAITINPPIWNNAFHDFQVITAIDNCTRGIKNVEELFEIQLNFKKKGFADDKVIKEVVDETINNARPVGKPLDNSSIWVYLLRYERHHNYPNDMRGFFIDAVHVYNNFVKGEEIDAPMHEKSTTGKYIVSLPPNTKYMELLASISLTSDYKAKSDKIFKDYYAIAPLFLKLKDTFKNGINLNEQYSGFDFDQYAEQLKKPGYDKVIKYCLYLLGISLGWQGTYQSCYVNKALPILQ